MNPTYRAKQQAAKKAWNARNPKRVVMHVKACKRRRWIAETAPVPMHECAAAIDLIFELTNQRRT